MKIYNETKKGNVEKAQNYQKVIVKSIEARLLAVRRVTQDNQGKATAGIDGIKNLQAGDRMKLIRKIVFDGSASMVRRV
jgi:RNA-directed DNA polymerase